MDGWAEQFFCRGETKVLISIASWEFRSHPAVASASAPPAAAVVIPTPHVACLVIVQDYILPNNRHATLFYHDHSVGITSENVYAGED